MLLAEKAINSMLKREHICSLIETICRNQKGIGQHSASCGSFHAIVLNGSFLQSSF